MAQQSLSVASEGASSSSTRPVLSIAPAAEWVNDQVSVPVAVSIAMPDTARRTQVDICCVIDVSGSMGEDAKFQDPEDASKFVSEGMNQLDIVKHSVKAVIHTLTDQDRLSLVAFHDDARQVFTLSEMNEGGKRQAIDALEALEPQNSTNIWYDILLLVYVKLICMSLFVSGRVWKLVLNLFALLVLLHDVASFCFLRMANPRSLLLVERIWLCALILKLMLDLIAVSRPSDLDINSRARCSWM